MKKGLFKIGNKKTSDNYRYLLAVDPGSNTGVLMYDKHEKKTIYMEVLNFWSFYDYVVETCNPESVQIVIEDPNVIPPTWNRKLKQPGSIKKRMDKIKQNVGMNKREASLLIDRFRAMGFSVLTPSPKGLGPKWSTTKFVKLMNPVEFYEIDSLPQTKFQHVFDAGRIAHAVL